MEMAHGIGLGLRMDMSEDTLASPPKGLKWLEIHPENYIHRGGKYPALLNRARGDWPLITHGLTMGFGNTEPFDRDYMVALKALLKDLEVPWHSDHMCFGGAHGVYAHDLLPTPFNEESLTVMARRYAEARDFLDVELAFENLSYYAEAEESEMDEASFVVALLERADAKMLLDVNNVYVNSKNLGFDAKEWIDRIPSERVLQIHVAGHLLRHDGFRIDTHAEAVCDDVYDLLDYALRRMGPKPVLLERDGNFPEFEDVRTEIERLDAIYQGATREAAS